MASLFSCTFPTIKDIIFKVYIDDSQHVGDATEVDAASDGFTLDYSGSVDDLLDPIKGSQLAFTVAVTDATLTALETFATDLISSAEGRFTIKVMRNSGVPLSADTLFWCGYVLPDLSGFEDLVPPYGFKIVATDGLGRLKGIPYNDGADPPEPYGTETFVTHILNCLNQGELAALYWDSDDHFLKTCVNWVDGNHGAPDETKCPLAYTRGNGVMFADRRNNDDVLEWKFDSCYTVIEKIMRDWQCRILFSDGAYRVEQIAERSQDTFYERRFSKDGTLRSSTDVAAADIAIDQDTVNPRLTGGIFSHMAALSRVEVTYEHKTAANLLTGTGGKWNIDSPQGDTVTISSISTDADTAFLIRGQILVKGALDGAYTTPWRYVFKLKVQKGSEYLNSGTASQQSNGTYLPVVVQEPYTWEGSLSYYEISSDFVFGSNINQYITFNIYVEGMPTGSGDISIQFTTEDAFKLSGAPEVATLTDWRVLNPVFVVIDSSSPNSWIEVDREYTAENPTTGNTKVLEAKNTFGYAVRSWTIPKLETSSNGSTWADSGVTWDQDTGTDNLEFGALWAREALALQRNPTGTYSGAFWSKSLFAHSRATFPDNTAYLMATASFTSREMVWTGEWFSAGVNRESVTISPVKKGGPPIKGGNPFEFSHSPVSVSPTTNGPGIKGVSDVAVAALAVNYVGSNISAGTITSLPLSLAASAGVFVDEDDLFIYNPSTAELITVTVATTNTHNATSLDIDSVAVPDIPAGAYILYSPLNRHTTAGGALPIPTNGYIMRAAGNKWDAYGGTTDGLPLVWDTTNGWQEEALGAAGIQAGAVTNAKLADMAAYTIKANITGVSFDPQDIGVGDLTEESTPAAGDYLVGWESGGAIRKFNVGDLPFITGNQTITLSGDVTGSGTTAITTTIANNAVTLAKMADIATDRLIGRDTAGTGDPESLTVGGGIEFTGSGGIQTSAFTGDVTKSAGGTALTLANSGVTPGTYTNSTVTVDAKGRVTSASSGSGSGVTGTGAASHIAYWDSTTNITYDNAQLYWDATNNRLGVGTNAPTASVQAGVATGTTGVGFYSLGSLSSNLANEFRNAYNTGGNGHSQLIISTGGANAGDPHLQFLVIGAATWSMGVDNSDSDKLKIKNQTLPSTGSNTGITIMNTAPGRVGINNDAPAYDLDVANTARAKTLINTQTSASISNNTGMGTGPTGLISFSTQNGLFYTFTTGSSPASNAVVFSVTPAVAFPSFMFPVIGPGNNNSVGAFRVGDVGNTSFNVYSVGALSASTTYTVYMVWLGY